MSSSGPPHSTRLFATGIANYRGMATEVHDTTSRLDRVRDCTDLDVLREALGHPGLQKTVRTAIERRIRRLERQAATHQEAQP